MRRVAVALLLIVALALLALLGPFSDGDPEPPDRGADATTERDVEAAPALAAEEAPAAAESPRAVARDTPSDSAAPPDWPPPVPEDWPLQVLVVDGANAPRPGIPVRFATGDVGPWLPTSSFDSTQSRAPDGLATATFDEGAAARLRAVSSMTALAAIPTATLATVDVPLDWQGAPPVLALPPLGEVLVSIRDQQGRAPEGRYGLSVWWAPAGTPYGDVRWSRQVLRFDATGGTARFFCAVGIDLSVSASPRGFDGPGGNVRAPGPRDPGEIARLTIELEPEWPQVRVVLVDPDGTPIERRRFSLHRRSVGGRPPISEPRYEASVSTDANGVAQFPFQPPLDSLDMEWVVLLGEERAPPWRPFEHGARQALLPIPRELAPGATHDAGELEIVEHREPLLVAGSVRRHDGTPLVAAVSLYPAEVERAAARRRLLEVRTEADGSFALHAPPPESGRVRVSAAARGLLADVRVVDVGTTGLELVLEAAAEVHGRFLFDEGFAARRLSVSPDASRSSPVSRSGRFRIDSLRSGEYRIRLFQDGALLYEGSPFYVPGPGVHRQPDVDLRGQLRVWRLHLLDAEGKDLFPRASVTMQLGEEEPTALRVGDFGKVVQALPAAAGSALTLRFGDGEPVVVPWAEGEITVTLE